MINQSVTHTPGDQVLIESLGIWGTVNTAGHDHAGEIYLVEYQIGDNKPGFTWRRPSELTKGQEPAA